MTSRRRLDPGVLIMAAGALIGLIIAAVGYLTPASGIAGTLGALLVVLSSAALLIAALVLPVLRARAYWLHLVAVVLCTLALIGTGAAAYLLELPLLIAATLAAALGLTLHLITAAGSLEYAR